MVNIPTPPPPGIGLIKNMPKISSTAYKVKKFRKNEIWECFDQKAKIHYCNLIQDRCTNRIGTTQLISSANRLTDFCIILTLTIDLK